MVTMVRKIDVMNFNNYGHVSFTDLHNSHADQVYKPRNNRRQKQTQRFQVYTDKLTYTPFVGGGLVSSPDHAPLATRGAWSGDETRGGQE